MSALPPLAATLGLAFVGRPALELDELWSYVGSKQQPAWVWVALYRVTRQVVACCLGDGGEESCRFLWQQVPEPWRGAVCYTDFWDAYGAVLPAAQHQVSGKGAGQTAHVERWNNRAAPTARTVCAQNAVVFQVRSSTQRASVALRTPLQPELAYHPRLGHYQSPLAL